MDGLAPLVSQRHEGIAKSVSCIVIDAIAFAGKRDTNRLWVGLAKMMGKSQAGDEYQRRCNDSSPLGYDLRAFRQKPDPKGER